MAIETLAAHSNRAFAKGNGECLCQQSAGNKSFEADFNYVLKVIFAQQMVGNFNRANLLPLEQHVKAFSGAKNATMKRSLYQDVLRTLHWPYAIALVDLGDCS